MSKWALEERGEPPPPPEARLRPPQAAYAEACEASSRRCMTVSNIFVTKEVAQAGIGVMKDAELLHKYVQSRDHEAFRVLAERHAGMVYGVALRRTTRPEIAEEAAQTAFVKLARKASDLKDPERVDLYWKLFLTWPSCLCRAPVPQASLPTVS